MVVPPGSLDIKGFSRLIKRYTIPSLGIYNLIFGKNGPFRATIRYYLKLFDAIWRPIWDNIFVVPPLQKRIVP